MHACACKRTLRQTQKWTGNTPFACNIVNAQNLSLTLPFQGWWWHTPEWAKIYCVLYKAISPLLHVLLQLQDRKPSCENEEEWHNGYCSTELWQVWAPVIWMEITAAGAWEVPCREPSFKFWCADGRCIIRQGAACAETHGSLCVQ